MSAYGALMALLYDDNYYRFLSDNHAAFLLLRTKGGMPYFSTQILCHEVVPPGLLRQLLKNLSRVFSLLRPQALILGLPFEPYEQSAILQSLPTIREMEALAKSRRCSIVFMGNVDAQESKVTELCGQISFGCPTVIFTIESFFMFLIVNAETLAMSKKRPEIYLTLFALAKSDFYT